jgi:protein-tyrosine phosphatase
LIDIHSHFLYGLDDGAKTLEDSLAMLRVAAESGTTDLVATPHANLQFKFDAAAIRSQIAELSAKTSVRLYSGCDFHLSYENIQDAIEHPQKYAINQKSYLLVEFSDLLIFRNTDEIFGRIQDAGMVPVITHPERNGLLRQRIEQIQSWIDAGACVQLTAQSLTGRFGSRAKEFSETLLDRGLVHFVASDAHDVERRPPKLNEAHAWLSKRYSESVANLLCIENPRAAIEGSPVQALVASEPKKWYQVWR